MIKVFNSDDKTYETNGNVVLNPTYANIHKEDNGDYYLDLETSVEEDKIKHIEHEEGTTIETTGTTLTNVDTTKENKFSSLYGNTTQESTPTPSSPQPIHNVSGDNTIEICGKNLFDVTSASLVQKGINSTTGVISGTNTKRLENDNLILLKSGTYTITNVICSAIWVWTYDINGQYQKDEIMSSWYNGNSYTFTLTNDRYVRFLWAKGDNSDIDITSNFQIQLEKSNQASTYEAYTGNSQLISLGVENLFDLSSATFTNERGTSITKNSDNIVIATNNNYARCYTTINTKVGQQYTLSCNFTNTNSQSIRIVVYEETGTTKLGESNTTTNTTGNLYVTFTATTTTSFVRIYGNTLSTIVSGSVTFSDIQLEKGSKANSYSPYGASYIELNKISTYQDYIYKSNNIWYLHKEIGKVVLDGSEAGWTKSGSYSNSYFINASDSYSINISDTNIYVCCNYYKSTYYSNVVNYDYTCILSNNKNIMIHNKDIDNLPDFKTWLSTHNTDVYYVLATPTNTEITDTTLLEQLNNFEKMKLYNGITNISITPNDLTPNIKLHYNYIDGGDVVINNNEYIKSNNIIVANTPTGEQAFRITDIEKRKHKIVLKAWHISYDTKNYVIQDSYVVDKTCNQAMDHLNNVTDNTSPFTTTSDITTINSYRCVRKSLFEAFNVVLERWGGHFVRDNWNFKIMNSIGQDNGVVVRYAKNLKDIQVTYDWTNVVTKILPVGNDGLLLDEVFLYADIQYDIPYTKVVHFDQNINEDDYRDEQGVIDEDAYLEALKNDLRSQATLYLQENYLPQVNYSLNANLEKITDIGDTIQVKDERLGVDITTNLISYDYDCILEKYTNLEFGNFTKTISDLTSYINSQTSQIVDENISTTRITLENELTTATSQIWGVLGGSYVLNEGDKILIVDSLPKETATNVIMINSAGIGFSQTGINGTFSTALTIDGTFNTSNVNVINFTADLIKGGALKLGSNLNQNGILEVYDEANNLIALLNKDGLRMNAVNGAYVLINQQVGFAGYDKNDNPIYWVSEDEFHMKKSVVEEEITLVDKMRIIPITITDNGTITNDGIGFVSTL